MPIKIVLIGHRGVGKSSFAKRWLDHQTSRAISAQVLDLDQIIASAENRPVANIFAELGEGVFRALEQREMDIVFGQTFLPGQRVCLVLGAGANISQIPRDWAVWWIRRTSDRIGRIFLDRPRLDSNLGPVEEFHLRHSLRDPGFSERADEVLFLEEGLLSDSRFEGAWIHSDIRDLRASITLAPDFVKSGAQFSNWYRRRADWGYRFFELRDDMLSEEQMAICCDLVNPKNLLISFRSYERENSSRNIQQRLCCSFDWPIERGVCEWGDPSILSVHHALSVPSAIQDFSSYQKIHSTKPHLKLAVPVTSFRDLDAGHEWRAEDPDNRSFLPSSPDGRWNWYRLHSGKDQWINFIFETQPSSWDQPNLGEWFRDARDTQQTENFAAVIGSPVSQSHSPAFHRDFFASLGHMKFYRIPTTAADLATGALEVLTKIGLRFAAVTSPLKKITSQLVTHADALSAKWQSVNTLALGADQLWHGTNTDHIGFRALLELAQSHLNFSPSDVAIWGGGGVVPSLLDALPGAKWFSFRSGDQKNKAEVEIETNWTPKLLIWGGSLNPSSNAAILPSNWAPSLVLDLNYSESSLGREYAKQLRCDYISGAEMFRAQALAQQNFWRTRI